MKKLFKQLLISLSIITISITSCHKENMSAPIPPPTWEVLPKTSSLTEFKQGIQQVQNYSQSYNLIAYLDTMPNGYPNIQGRKIPLIQITQSILSKLNGDEKQIESAVYDVFHFDEATFSLISYLMKTNMAGDISVQTLATIVANIPLPPVTTPDFAPPFAPPVALGLVGDCCKDNICNPTIKILVTWTYKPACGNYVKKTSGYAAGNKLTHMSGGVIYRFDAEIGGCPCPGVLTSSVTAPPGASFGTGVCKSDCVCSRGNW